MNIPARLRLDSIIVHCVLPQAEGGGEVTPYYVVQTLWIEGYIHCLGVEESESRSREYHLYVLRFYGGCRISFRTTLVLHVDVVAWSCMLLAAAELCRSRLPPKLTVPYLGGHTDHKMCCNFGFTVQYLFDAFWEAPRQAPMTRQNARSFGVGIHCRSERMEVSSKIVARCSTELQYTAQA